MLDQQQKEVQQPYQAVHEESSPKVTTSETQTTTADQQGLQKPQANKTGIPDNLKASMEYMYGISLSEVRVHYNSEKPATMGAYAYTEGLNIYIAPGQEKHLAHEIAHVVQQLRGQVKETVQFKKGVAGNDEGGLEAKADKEGKQALQLAKVPELLPQKELDHKTSSHEIVQRVAIKTNYGTFKDENYGVNGNELVAQLSFDPGTNTDATKIGLTQTVKRVNDGKTVAKDPNQKTKMTAQGHKVDTSFSDDTPIYGSDPLGTGKTLADTPQDNNATSKPTSLDPVDPTKQANATYELGHHYKQKPTDTTWQTKKAGLLDKPTINPAKNSSLEFETAAVALEGNQKGMYYGSIKWGYTIGTTAASSAITPISKISDGVPSKNFMETAQEWNKGKVGGTLVTNKNTILGINGGTSAAKIPVGVVVTYLGVGTGNKGKDIYATVELTYFGQQLKGEINIDDLTDSGDGASTHDLPLVDVHVVKGTTATLYKDQKGTKKSTKLPQNSRVKILKKKKGMAEIEVVDGSKTGVTGWIKKTDLKKE